MLLNSVALLLVAGLLSQAGAVDQVPVCCAHPIEYGNANSVDPDPLHLRNVTGLVAVGSGPTQSPWPACLGLFTEGDHKLVASAMADLNGKFGFAPVPPGSYHLVVRDPQNALCVANIPLRVVRWPRGGFIQRRELLIHLVPTGIDACSCGTYRE